MTCADSVYSALSAYMFFVSDWRERIIAENPSASFGEVGKLLGARWKEMSESEKKVSGYPFTQPVCLVDRDLGDHKLTMLLIALQ